MTDLETMMEYTAKITSVYGLTDAVEAILNANNIKLNDTVVFGGGAYKCTYINGKLGLEPTIAGVKILNLT